MLHAAEQRGSQNCSEVVFYNLILINPKVVDKFSKGFSLVATII